MYLVLVKNEQGMYDIWGASNDLSMAQYIANNHKTKVLMVKVGAVVHVTPD